MYVYKMHVCMHVCMYLCTCMYLCVHACMYLLVLWYACESIVCTHTLLWRLSSFWLLFKNNIITIICFEIFGIWYLLCWLVSLSWVKCSWSSPIGANLFIYKNVMIYVFFDFWFSFKFLINNVMIVLYLYIYLYCILFYYIYIYWFNSKYVYYIM